MVLLRPKLQARGAGMRMGQHPCWNLPPPLPQITLSWMPWREIERYYCRAHSSEHGSHDADADADTDSGNPRISPEGFRAAYSGRRLPNAARPGQVRPGILVASISTLPATSSSPPPLLPLLAPLLTTWPPPVCSQSLNRHTLCSSSCKS